MTPSTKTVTLTFLLTFAMIPALPSRAAEYTALQREAHILAPEMQDSLFGKVDRIYLNGYWKFKDVVNYLARKGGRVVVVGKTENPKTDVGLEQGYYQPGFDDSTWEDLPVPGMWNTSVTQPGKRDVLGGVGYYRTKFDLPASKQGKRVILHFDNVQSECTIWVNGKEAGRHSNDVAYCALMDIDDRRNLEDFELDVTDYVQFGKTNSLVLRVYGSGLPLTDGPWHNVGGIIAPVYVEMREQIHMPRILVKSNVSAGTVELLVTATNQNKTPQSLPLTVDITPFESKYYKSPAKGTATVRELGNVTFPVGKSTHRFTVKLENPVPWSPGCPFLYFLQIKADGKTLGYTRFGFRQFEVRGKRFYLNGHPIYLRGLNPHATWSTYVITAAYNHGNWMRYALMLLKEANVNTLRVHMGPSTDTFYDICDELGIITEDDYSPDYRMMAVKEIKHAEMMAEIKVSSYMDSKGKFTPKVKRQLKHWLNKLHNHPSVCMLSGGNEIGPHRPGSDMKDLAIYVNNFYDFMKANDFQKRPVTPSSGLVVWMWDRPVKADYYDFHCYQDVDMGWADCVAGNMRFYRFLEKIFGKIDKPVINGECTFIPSTWCYRPETRALADKNGKLNKRKYLQWVHRLAKSTKRINPADWLAQSVYTRFAGVRSTFTPESLRDASVDMRHKYLHVFRRDMPFLEGFMMHSFGPIDFGLSVHDIQKGYAHVRDVYEKGRQRPEMTSFRNAMSPRLVTLDMYDRHQFAGGTFRSSVYIINQLHGAKAEPMTVELSLQDAKGRRVATKTLDFGVVKPHSRPHMKFKLPLPSDMACGDCTVGAKLFVAGKVVNEQTFKLLVARRTANPKALGKQVTARIALYDGPGKTAAVLDHLGIRYSRIKTFGGLDKFDVLVIGANAIDAGLEKARIEIRRWLSAGGKIVCLEQKRTGLIPFLTKLSFRYAGNMFYADLIEREHPTVKKTKPWHWRVWNGNRKMINGAWYSNEKAVYDTIIQPMPRGVVIAGGVRGGEWYKTAAFGMLGGEIKVGKGLVYFSQVLATKRYGTDSVATQYLENLFKYTLLGKRWNGRFASKVAGQAREILRKEDCFSVDLAPYANRRLSDKGAKGNEGNWTDDVSGNDLRDIPRGQVTFMGVPYHILDDTGNKKACMILRGKERPKFPQAIRGIKVGHKARRFAFLHGVAWGSGGRRKVGQYVVHYADGTKASVDLIVPENIGEWWGPRDLPKAKVACKFKNAFGAMVGLYTYLWTNPHPERTIATIDFISVGNGPVPICVAITGIK